MQPEEGLEAAVAQAMAVPNPSKKAASGKKKPAPEVDEKISKGKKEAPKKASQATTAQRLDTVCA